MTKLATHGNHWRSLVTALCVVTHESNKMAVLPRTIVIWHKLHIVVAQSPIRWSVLGLHLQGSES